jgi:hypothetical protein
MTLDSATTPDRPAWQRPPFESGNTAALVSGGRSPRVYGLLAQQLAAGLAEDRPDLGHYPEAVAAWATAEAQAALFRRRLDEVGALDDDGNPRGGLLGWLSRTEAAAARHRAALGLDPRAEAVLTRDRAAAAALASAVDLGALAARGRAALDAREAAGIEAAPDLAGLVLARMAARAPVPHEPSALGIEAVTETPSREDK